MVKAQALPELAQETVVTAYQLLFIALATNTLNKKLPKTASIPFNLLLLITPTRYTAKLHRQRAPPAVEDVPLAETPVQAFHQIGLSTVEDLRSEGLKPTS